MEDHKYDDIDRYLDNKMSEEERVDFERECKKNPEKALLLKEKIKYRMALLKYGREHVRDLVTSRNDVQDDRKTIRLKVYWRAAAVLLFLAVASFSLFYFLRKEPSRQQLYAVNIAELPSPSVRDEAEEDAGPLDKSWNDFLESYQRKNWTTSIDHLNNLLQQPDFDRKNEAYLYLGISYLLSDQEEMALRSFDSVDRDSKALYYGSQWYAALTYLKLNEKEKALKTLEALENSRTYRIKAAELSSAISGL
jgi:hypothetical protein